MKIAFFTHPYPNYVPDLLLHGLRKLMGPGVVDFPRKDCLYDGVLGLGVCPPDQRCPGWFPSEAGLIDREDVAGKLNSGFFDLVVSDIRALNTLRKLAPNCETSLVVIDGEDRPFPVPPGPYVICRRETDGSDFSIPLPMGLPEEVLNWIASYDDLPKKHSIGFLGSTQEGNRRRIAETIAAHFPDALLEATPVPSPEDPNPSGRFGRDDYYRYLQQCRIVLSLPGAGYDTFRFWENAACNAVHVAARMPLFIPNEFVDGSHILRFSDVDQLKRHISDCLNNDKAPVEMIQKCRHHLNQHHLTTDRARYFLDQVTTAFQLGPVCLDLSSEDTKRFGPSSASAKPALNAEYNSADTKMCDEHEGKNRGTPVGLEHCPGNPARSDSSEEEPLFLGLVEGNNYGWGVCSQYLIRELSQLKNCHVINSEDGSANNPAIEGKLFQAITGIDFFPMFEKASGRQNIGYTFFENELNPTSIANANHYDLVLGGSSWCRDRMLEKGISHCDVLIQGIDPEFYYPVEDSLQRDNFVIFSGGKFELRKGQDLVLKAVKILQDRYDDILLVNCWYNIWPESMSLMAYSEHIRFEYREMDWQDLMLRVYRQNGLDPQRVQTCDVIPKELQRELYRQTDLGVFPNRCEGGTNLVLMEYMACGKPVIASYTSGHTDVLTNENALLLKEMSPYNIVDAHSKPFARWQEPSLDELVAQIEYAYHHRESIRELGERAGRDMKNLTWRHTAQNLLDILYP